MSRASFIRSLQGFPRISRRVSLEAINRTVASAMGQDEMVLRSKDRTAPVSNARQEAMRRAHEAGYSFSAIARFYDRDHTTIAHGVAAAAAR